MDDKTLQGYDALDYTAGTKTKLRISGLNLITRDLGKTLTESRLSSICFHKVSAPSSEASGTDPAHREDAALNAPWV